MFALCEPGEAVIMPGPVYPGFLVDLGARTGVELVMPARSIDDAFEIDLESIDAAVRETRSRGIEPRAILIASPDNPTARLDLTDPDQTLSP